MNFLIIDTNTYASLGLMKFVRHAANELGIECAISTISAADISSYKFNKHDIVFIKHELLKHVSIHLQSKSNSAQNNTKTIVLCNDYRDVDIRILMHLKINGLIHLSITQNEFSEYFAKTLENDRYFDFIKYFDIKSREEEKHQVKDNLRFIENPRHKKQWKYA